MKYFFNPDAVKRASDILLQEFSQGSYTTLAEMCGCTRQHTHFVITRGGLNAFSAYAMILKHTNVAISDFIALIEAIEGGVYSYQDLQNLTNGSGYTNITQQDLRNAMFARVDIKAPKFFSEREKFGKMFNVNPDHVGKQFSNPTISTGWMFCTFYKIKYSELIKEAESLAAKRHVKVREGV